MSLPLDPKKLQRPSFVNAKAYVDYSKDKRALKNLPSSNLLLSWADSYTYQWAEKNQYQRQACWSHCHGAVR